jgi:hypothetical protein
MLVVFFTNYMLSICSPSDCVFVQAWVRKSNRRLLVLNYVFAGACHELSNSPIHETKFSLGVPTFVTDATCLAAMQPKFELTILIIFDPGTFSLPSSLNHIKDRVHKGKL